ncbi:MAG: GtrA family protein [Clostridia bacterium]|nr:GtrA family protein [Clostridia bacterium]
MLKKLLHLVRDSFTRPKKVFIEPTDDTFYQLARTVVVGLICTVCDTALMYIVKTQLHWHTAICFALGYFLGTVINYLLGIWFIFKQENNISRGVEFLLFCVIAAIGMGLNSLIGWLLVDVWGLMPEIPAKLVATVIAFSWTFGARKWGLYRKKRV